MYVASVRVTWLTRRRGYVFLQYRHQQWRRGGGAAVQMEDEVVVME